MKNIFLFILSIIVAVMLFFIAKSSKGEGTKMVTISKNGIELISPSAVVSSYSASSVTQLKGPKGQAVWLIQDRDVVNVYKTVNEVCGSGYDILKDGMIAYPKNIYWVLVDCL